MTEQYKIGDRFMLEEDRGYDVIEKNGKDVILVLSHINESTDGIFVVEEYYNPEKDYSSLEGRHQLGTDNYEWIPLDSDNLIPVVTSKAPKSLSQQIDESLGLVTITLRLDKELVDKYKVIAYDNQTSIEVLMREKLGTV